MQVFVYINVEFETSKNEINQALIWSNIVEQRKDANIQEIITSSYPYALTDPGKATGPCLILANIHSQVGIAVLTEQGPYISCKVQTIYIASLLHLFHIQQKRAEVLRQHVLWWCVHLQARACAIPHSQ